MSLFIDNLSNEDWIKRLGTMTASGLPFDFNPDLHPRDDHGRFTGGAPETVQGTLTNGGATVAFVHTERVPEHGKVLSPYEKRERVVPVEAFRPETIHDFVRANRDLLALPDHFLGTWVNEGKVYLDVSIAVDNAQTAERLAREHGQRAYYDLDTDQEVYVAQAAAQSVPRGGRRQADPFGHREAARTSDGRSGGTGRAFAAGGSDDGLEAGFYALLAGAWDESLHPRDERGRFTDSGGGAQPSGTDEHVVYAEEMASDATVTHTDNIAEAAVLLAEGKRVELSQPREVSTLLNELADYAKQAEAATGVKPVFDLCNVSVAGTNLFCQDSLGIDRVDMPQLGGFPIPGSKADDLPRTPDGGVDITDQFIQSLRDKGYAVTEGTEQASYMRATQRELDAGKTAAIAKNIAANGYNGPPMVLSRDNYILDGHHRWSGAVAVDVGDNHLGDVTLPVLRVDIDTVTMLVEATRFAREWGIPQKAFGGFSASSAPLASPVNPQGEQRYPVGGEWDHLNLVNPMSASFLGAKVGFARARDVRASAFAWDESQHPRDDRGRFVGDGSSDSTSTAPTHAVGVVDPNNPGAFIQFSKPQQPGESDRDYHDRVFREREQYAPVPSVVACAEGYRAQVGLPNPDFGPGGLTNIEADYERGFEVARFYLGDPPDDDSPGQHAEKEAAYRDLVDQTMAQAQAIADAGVTIEYLSPQEIIDRGLDPLGLNPYPDAAKQAEDIRDNKRLMIASIADYPESYHPFLTNTKGGEYDTFRGVHDFFGHAGGGAGFDRHGEFQAYLEHLSMFTGEARRAASSELTCENSVLWTTHMPAPHYGALLPESAVDLFDADGHYKGLPVPAVPNAGIGAGFRSFDYQESQHPRDERGRWTSNEGVDQAAAAQQSSAGGAHIPGSVDRVIWGGGMGTDGFGTIRPGAGFGTTLADGREMHLNISPRIDPANLPTRDELTTMLTTIADLYEMDPVSGRMPSLSLVPLPSGAPSTGAAFTTPENGNVIRVIEQEGGYGAINEMVHGNEPIESANQLQFILSHEYGHLVEFSGKTTGTEATNAMGLVQTWARESRDTVPDYVAGAQMPPHGTMARAAHEAYAEAYATYRMSGGDPSIPIVNAYARNEGWDKARGTLPTPKVPPPKLPGMRTWLPFDYEESQHPRDEHGRWTSGGVSSDAPGTTIRHGIEERDSGYYALQLANGNAIEFHDSGGYVDFTEAREAISVVADVMERDPAIGRTGIIDLHVVSAEVAAHDGAETAAAYVMPKDPYTINLIEDRWVGRAMLTVPPLIDNTDLSLTQYVVTHELGHTREWVDRSQGAASQALYQEARIPAPGVDSPPVMTEYGRSNSHEAYAEAYAGWMLTGGHPPISASYAYARKFGWP